MDLLFTPAKLGTCELKNRIVRSATNGHLSDEKGQVCTGTTYLRNAG